MKPEPFRIEPKYVPRIWGASSLAPLYPEKSNLPEPIGEVWLTGVDCKVASGPFVGETLGEAWREMPAEWRGTRFTAPGDFPILVKFIFPKDKLSIQVHPDDAYAAANEQAAGGRGKTEMWYAVSSEPHAQVLVGLKPGTDKQRFVDSLAARNLETLFEAHEVKAGDTFFVPAGTPHTIGPGMVLCEVQEYSDLTYRVYDYGRVDSHGEPRELHIEKALDVTNFGKFHGGRVRSLPLPSHDAFKFLLAACPYFAVEQWEFEWKWETRCDPTHFDLFVVLTGEGSFGWPEREIRYSAGECWLVPSSLATIWLAPLKPTSLLRVCVPDFEALPGLLKSQGINERAAGRVLFF